MSGIVVHEEKETGAISWVVTLDVADQAKVEPEVLAKLEESLRDVLEVVTGQPDPVSPKLRRRLTGLKLWAGLKAFVSLLLIIAIIVGALRVVLWVILGVWGLI
jgi:hypothetical protein